MALDAEPRHYTIGALPALDTLFCPCVRYLGFLVQVQSVAHWEFICNVGGELGVNSNVTFAHNYIPPSLASLTGLSGGSCGSVTIIPRMASIRIAEQTERSKRLI